MSRYSLAEAQSDLPALVDRALSGEEVVLTRDGEPVADLRGRGASTTVATGQHSAAEDGPPTDPREAVEWLIARRAVGPPVRTTAVELLRGMYEDE